MKKRRITKIGSSHDIRLSPADLSDFDLKEGDFVDISDIVKVQND